MSRLLRPIVKSRNLVRRIDRPADQLDGRSYLLLRGQSLPSQHGLLQRGAIGRDACPVVQRGGAPAINIDFVVVAHQRWPNWKSHLNHPAKGAAGGKRRGGGAARRRFSIARELIDDLARFIPDHDERLGLSGPAVFQQVIYY